MVKRFQELKETVTSFSFSSLRVRLILLVLLAVIPALGLIIYTAAEQRRAAAGEAQANALQLARSVSSSQDDLIEGARQLLTALAQMPFIQSANPSVCNSVLSKLLREYKNYAGLGVATPAGEAFCSSHPIPVGLSFADRSWFQGALQTGDFFIGEYQVGRISRKATLGLGYPVRDEAGQFKAILYAGLDLNWLNALAAKTQLPSGASLTVIDRKGTIIVCYPDPQKWVGQPMASMPLARTVLAQGEGVAEALGVDGLPRLYGFTPLGSETPAAYVTIGIPKDVSIATANRILTRNLVGLGIVGALAFLAAWFGADLFVLRQVHALGAIAKRLSGGELGARTGLSYGQGELGELARVFDQMAEALQTRQAEIKRSEEQIRDSLKRIETLNEISNAISSTLDMHTVLNLLMEKIDIFLPRTAIQVWLLNKEKDFLERTVCWNLDEAEWKGREMERIPPLVQEAFEGRMPVTVMNIQTDPRVLDPQFFRKHGLLSYLGVPMLVKDEPIGVLIFHTRELHEFAKEEIRFFSTLAGQAAIAIHNSRLFEETKASKDSQEAANQQLSKSLDELSRLYAALTPLDPSGSVNQMLDSVIERLMHATGADAAMIRLQEKATLAFVCASQRGFPALYLERVRTVPPGSALDYVFNHGEPIIASNIAADPRLKGKVQVEVGLRSCALLPLRVGKEPRGIVHLASREPGYFNEEKGEHLMAIARQMGIAIENRELFDELRASKIELEKASKVKDEFLGFISHELKTPINSVVGYAAMMQDRILGEINEQQERALGEVVTRSKELLGMINSLLEATKVGAGAVQLKMVEVALGHFLDELRSGYNVSLDKELTLIWDYPPDLPAIMIDSEKLKHILENLLNNAIKYTDRGNVTISARYVDGVGARAGSGQQPGDHGHVELKVADTGIGIPKEEISFIFEMFRQVEGSQRRSSGGVGLGLHIVKTFTEMLGGKIDVESEVGKGSTFTVTIPCQQEAIGSRQ